jgi:hypothetical protein
LAKGSYPAGLDVSEASLDAFEGLQLLDPRAEFLVGGGVLNDQLGFAVDCEDEGMAGVSHLGKEFAGFAFEVAQGMDVGADVEHEGLLHSIYTRFDA